MNPRLITGLTIPLAVVSVLLLIIAIGSALYVRSLQQSISHLMSHHVASVRAAQELEISIREVRSQFDRYLITADKKHLEPVPRLKERIEAALLEAESAATTNAEYAFMRRARDGCDAFFRGYESIIANQPPGGLYPNIIDLIETVRLGEVLEPAHEYLRWNEGMLSRTSEENRELVERLTLGMLGLGICGAIGGMLAGWLISAGVRRSMQRTEERLRDTAAQLDQAIAQPHPPTDSTLQPDSALEQVTVSVSAVLKRLRQTERDALRAEQLAWVGQMAAGIAHEIRNPLMAIKILVQVAADRRSGQPLRARDLQVLEEEIVRLEQIVNGFLDFARPTRPELREVNLVELVQKSIERLRQRAELHGVEVQIDSPPESRLLVQADPNQLRQVLVNLVYNALDAQPQGGTICLGWDCSSESIELIVADSGPGLPPELGEMIFEPFISTKESGMGLGLSICRRIVESHGGRLTATNRPEGGAEFRICLQRVTHDSRLTSAQR
ncbi:sensor histidine kinase [Tuwongella immobilis]|uniref:histidine kinase n=1 Tax=Tuwongella immobilis TaxID=692036 RepID=A0A6C2YPT9_9BACT|nr:ATP-binding protein [Tuwongella immobilis]VIP03414.1 histidine kinase : Histidine kinase OS=Singulisphaera acidiphila (strain ATCC BAA-1392 / DSM 18658 / VKM B-2454 / MOB10) GN=Sinac_0783 PE=4 SV=1: HisKA: HATPase_c [Tuwongella immobilis]VTS04200.1 histidine kinase : Histidine kinase OS=Singulisphaera acidiphila (strain ATCC BAA-1392 / DSM 18658 / VKM B-2454 / MOB10) GN=Sinac_0783 PE=4 SV=1: HisKA: HATPase_c [Tuwongella immobilis]